MSIHKTAIISPTAKLGKDISVGPNTIIGDKVRIGDGTVIGANCVLDGNTLIGAFCEIFTGAIIGSKPQDLKYKGENSSLVIGNNNIIREYCTLNIGTGESGQTKIGNGNLIMAYSHVAHDCVIGSNCIIANGGTLAGHVTIEDKAVIGGLVAIHQFVRIGMLSIIGGCSKVVQDIPPFSTCDGHPAVVYGLNIVGLRRNGIPSESSRKLSHAFKILFNSQSSLKNSLTNLQQESIGCDEVRYLVDFVKKTKRGLSRSCRFRQKQA
jgi:UDP-N-acetylglucosamine acyltransferase